MHIIVQHEISKRSVVFLIMLIILGAAIVLGINISFTLCGRYVWFIKGDQHTCAQNTTIYYTTLIFVRGGYKLLSSTKKSLYWVSRIPLVTTYIYLFLNTMKRISCLGGSCKAKRLHLVFVNWTIYTLQNDYNKPSYGEL